MKAIISLIMIAALILVTGCIEVIEQEFPLETGKKVREFIGNEYGLECDGEGWISEMTTEIPFENGCYGYCGSTGAKGMSGEMAYVYRINPNTGWIWQLFCNEEYLDNCPEIINNYPSDFPEGPCKGCFVYDECRVITG